MCNAGDFTTTWNAVILEKELHIIKIWLLTYLHGPDIYVINVLFIEVADAFKPSKSWRGNVWAIICDAQQEEW